VRPRVGVRSAGRAALPRQPPPGGAALWLSAGGAQHGARQRTGGAARCTAPWRGAGVPRMRTLARRS